MFIAHVGLEKKIPIEYDLHLKKSVKFKSIT